MTNPLVQDAIARVWCSPDQDYQYIFEPARVTPHFGCVRQWRMLMTTTWLPNQTDRFHLFQLGRRPPQLVNMFPRGDQLCDMGWTSLKDTCNANNVVCDVYFEKGVRLHNSDVYFTVTEEGNCLLAVKDISSKWPGYVSVRRDAVYLRVYRNSYFTSTRHTPGVDRVYYGGGQCKTIDDLIAVQMEYNTAVTKPGHVYAFRNGIKINSISLLTCSVGDWVEFCHDSSIKRIVDLPVRGLRVFDSLVDYQGKYLLHPPKNQSASMIEYGDDVDIFLHSSGDKPTGVYVHKNTPRALRMVTHVDYSTPVDHIRFFLENNELFTGNADTATIRLHIRHSGYARPLIDEINRIHELYKLSDDKIIQAMTGLNSVAPVWRADQLESSDYCRLMDAERGGDITFEQVTNAYGYHGVTRVVADAVKTPTLFSGVKVVAPPLAFESNATAFEYDADGYLLGWYAHDGGVYYNCKSQQTKAVEFIRGKGDKQLVECFNQSCIVDNNHEWRFYTFQKGLNPQIDHWVDVTGDTNKYSIQPETGLLTWTCSATHYTLARSNEKFFLEQIQLDTNDGLLEHNIRLDHVVDGVVQSDPAVIPFGELDIWLNRKLLIEGLDYHLNWPHLLVINKQYLINAPTQELIIRGKGHCTATFERNDVTEVGFIRNGQVSRDHEYDTRMFKSTRTYVAGGLKLPSELTYNEDAAVGVMQHALNGQPYCVKNNVTGVKKFTGLDSYSLYWAAVGVDRSIEKYLTQHAVGVQRDDTINVIAQYHRVYSPFISKITMDLKRGIFTPTFIDSAQYSNSQVIESVRDYQYLFKYDPIADDLRPDLEFIKIDPHCYTGTVQLTVSQYRFIQRLVSIYASGLMQLSNHYRV